MKLLRLSEENSVGSLPAKATQVMMYHDRYTAGETNGGLSVIFTMLCIIDLFGVFPVVALPKSIITCGIYGIPLVLAVVALQLYTAVLLGRSWILAHDIAPNIREKSRFPYAAVAELAFGTTSRRMVTFLIDATVFSAGVPNFIFASQSMQLFWWKITDGDVGISYCVWMVVIGLLLCPVMWLGSPKDMKPLAVMSVLIVTTVAVSTWTCIINDDTSPPASGDVLAYVPDTRDFLVAYGIMVYQQKVYFPMDTDTVICRFIVIRFSLVSVVFIRIGSAVWFDIHPMLLTLQVDMKDSRRIHSAVLGGFAATGLMFTVTSFLAAKRYGNNIQSNILQGLPPSIVLYIVALLVTLQLCLSSAVGNSALFQHLEDLLKIPREFCLQRCIIRSSVIALAVFLGESVPRFDLVMGLIGSTLTGPLMFIFPPLFFLRLCYKKSSMPNTNTTIVPFNKLRNYKKPKSLGRDPSRMALFIHSFDTKYKTFTTTLGKMGEDEMDEYNIKWYDIVLAVIVMLLGIMATALATYSSWSDAISSASFSPPCLLNASAAARSFIERNVKMT